MNIPDILSQNSWNFEIKVKFVRLFKITIKRLRISSDKRSWQAIDVSISEIRYRSELFKSKLTIHKLLNLKNDLICKSHISLFVSGRHFSKEISSRIRYYVRNNYRCNYYDNCEKCCNRETSSFVTLFVVVCEYLRHICF